MKYNTKALHTTKVVFMFSNDNLATTSLAHSRYDYVACRIHCLCIVFYSLRGKKLSATIFYYVLYELLLCDESKLEMVNGNSMEKFPQSLI